MEVEALVWIVSLAFSAGAMLGIAFGHWLAHR